MPRPLHRVHAFEFNERPECPRFVREGIVESLGLGLRWGQIYDGVGPLFAEFCERARCRRVLDLCAGTGEPVSILLSALARTRRGWGAPRFVLSDLLPNVPAMERVAARFDAGAVEVIREPVDATAVPDHIGHDARTIISAFHHFPPALASAILGDAVRGRRPIFVVEPFPRRPLGLAAALPAMAVAMAAMPALSRRARLRKALFTYAVPLIPALGMWDAIVSMLRMYSRRELMDMVEPLGEGYRWSFHRAPYFPGGRAIVFHGIPRDTAS